MFQICKTLKKHNDFEKDLQSYYIQRLAQIGILLTNCGYMLLCNEFNGFASLKGEIMKILLRIGIVICLLIIIYFALISRHQYFQQDFHAIRINRLTGNVELWFAGKNNNQWFVPGHSK